MLDEQRAQRAPPFIIRHALIFSRLHRIERVGLRMKFTFLLDGEEDAAVVFMGLDAVIHASREALLIAFGLKHLIRNRDDKLH